MIAAGAQSTCAAKMKYTPGDAVRQAREHVLQRVRALQVLGERHAEDPQQQDPLGGAEVAAVDARHVDRERRRTTPALVDRVDFALGHVRV